MNKLILMILPIFTFFIIQCEKDKSLLFINEADKYITAPITADYGSIPDPEERWNAYKISDYAIIQQHGCFCLYRSPYKIFVVNNQIQDVLDIMADTLLAEKTKEHIGLLTIDKLFLLAKSISQDTVAFFEIIYDNRFGFPSSIRVDPDSFIVDEEYSYETSSLEKIVEIRK